MLQTTREPITHNALLMARDTFDVVHCLIEQAYVHMEYCCFYMVGLSSQRTCVAEGLGSKRIF
jgi:hypothetical protein